MKKFNKASLSKELEVVNNFVVRKDYDEHKKCKKSKLKDGTEFCDKHFLVLKHKIK